MAQSVPARRSIRVRLADRPGSLNDLTRIVAEQGVNVARLEVVSWEHADVWDDVELVASDLADIDCAITHLREAGLEVLGLPPAWSIRDWAVEVLEGVGRMAAAADPTDALDVLVTTAAHLTQTRNVVVLIDRPSPQSDLAAARWSLLADAASAFDARWIDWSGRPDDIDIVIRAMSAARHGTEPGDREPVDRVAGSVVGAVVPIPAPRGVVALLAAMGRRPPFLDPELRRLGLMADVAGPYALRPVAAAS